MEEQITNLAPKIKAEINESKRILLHLHPNSDPDSVGSVLAMRLVLVGMGKEVTVISGDNEPPAELSFLTGYETIKPLAFDQVNLTDYDLFLVLDSAAPQQITDHISLNFPLVIPSIVIDHHAKNPNFGEQNLVVPSMSSTSELLYRLFKEWQVPLTTQIAACLFVGIWGDTGGAVYSSTTADTFATLADLASCEIDTSKIVFMMRVRSNRALLAFGRYLSGVENLYAGRMLYLELNEDKMLSESLTPVEVDLVMGMVSTELSASGEAWLTVVAKERQNGKQVGLSLRNNNLLAPVEIDVSRIARVLGGGGHPRSSGARFYGKTIAEVRKMLMEKVEELYPQIKEE